MRYSRQRHRRIRRLHARTAHRQRPDARRNEKDPRGDPVRRIRQTVDRRKQDRPPQIPRHARRAAQTSPIETVGRELRDMMTFLKKKKEVGVP